MENQNPQTVPQVTHAHNDGTTWALPEDAIARLGKGIIADLAFSPDSESLVVATTMGCWLYELPTMKPIALWHLATRFLTG